MEEIMIGREMNPKEMIPEEENQEGAKIFGKLAGASLLYALVYTGCLFENVMGTGVGALGGVECVVCTFCVPDVRGKGETGQWHCAGDDCTAWNLYRSDGKRMDRLDE